MKQALLAKARELGFERAGVCSAEAPLADPGLAAAWIEAGRHAGMAYLARDMHRRLDPRALLPSARSLLVVAVPYPPAREGAPVAAYARLADYHREMKSRLDALLAFARERDPEVQGVACVDTKPLLERAAAERAGLGWIGKNTLLMDEEHGPWLMLGVLVLSLALEPDAAPAVARCGTCTRCLDACPTRAFAAPYVLDARRCISYWTIEHRGAAPLEFRLAQGTRVFGCDDCLAVCPFPRHRDGSAASLLPIAPEIADLDAREALRRAEESFTRHFKRFAIERAGKAGLIRNCLTALGNGGDRADVERVAPHLDSADAGVRTHAAWALGRLGGARAAQALRERKPRETDVAIVAEIDAALAEASR